MTDQNDRRVTVLSVLVSGLLVAVIIQSAAIFSMNRKLNQTIQPREQTPAAEDRNYHAQVQPKTAKPGKFPDFNNKDFFDWDIDDWDPFKEMHSMHDRINKMFGSAFNRFRGSDNFGSLLHDYAFEPDINVEDKDGHYLVTVDLPGTEDSRLEVKLEEQTLTISGSVQSESRKESKGKMLRQERRSGKFQRSVTLPGPVKADKMTTENRKGVLYIKIPKETT